MVGSVFSALSVWPTRGGPRFLHSSRLSSSLHSQLVQRARSEPRGQEPLLGAGHLHADTAVSLLVFLGWLITCVASECSNLRPQIILCSSFLLCLFASVALFIFLKYFLLVCVSWHVPSLVFLNAILIGPLCHS